MLVYVLDRHGKPLMPCGARKARKLLAKGKAVVKTRLPFTIKLLYWSHGYKQPVTLKVDAGSKVIGTAVVNETSTLYVSEVKLRTDIHRKMKQRSDYRKMRRARKTRYRPARYQHRKRE